MMFRMNFKTDNEAFGETQFTRADEIGRILRAIADTVDKEDMCGGKVYDANGNEIGTWRIDP